ncbi:hypothetical protein [Tsukamurella sp. NPDC003166]|uniref:hypothetical protein n=1 Tax=Tsukamurella sp. NPDC003166 TaxID=3154444 RepID=UPI0033BBACF8
MRSGTGLPPDGSYPASAIARDAELLRPMPMPELRDVVDWADRLPAVGAAVTAPVRLTFAAHDKIWRSDDEAVAAVSRHFTAAPFTTALLAGVGHSIELHHLARAYVLSQLSFVEQALA